MCVRALTIVMIVASRFYDYMHCTSLHLVIAVRMCPASSESKVMFAHTGQSGSWFFGVSVSSRELGMRGFEHDQQFSQVVRAPISAPYFGFQTWVSSRQRYLRGGRSQDKESDTDP